MEFLKAFKKKFCIFLFFILISLVSAECCFAKDKKIRYLVNNSDVEFYCVEPFLFTLDYEDPIGSFSTVKLKDGRVLITGGIVRKLSGDADVTNRTLIYYPELGNLGKFVYGPDMHYRRYSHSSILLPDGRVFIYGGAAEAMGRSRTCLFDTTEIYDPKLNTFRLGPDLIKNIYQGFVSQEAVFVDDKKEYLYIVTNFSKNLLDLENYDIYAFDPVRPPAPDSTLKNKVQTVGTDTIIGFENKALEKELVKKMKQFPLFRGCGIVHYKDDLYYLVGGRIASAYNIKRTNTISLYNAKTKEEKIIDTKMASDRVFTDCLKLKNNKVLIWGKDYKTREYTYELFDMETQKIKSIDFHISNIDSPVVLDDGSIFWMGIRSNKRSAYILKFKEGVLD